MGDLKEVPRTRKTGGEPFRRSGKPAGFDVLDFWQWSVSDLVSNATRGRLAEYIVARAICVPTDGVRDEWSACDLCTPDGVNVEVKSAAYLQSWAQKKLSDISFSVRKSRPWASDTNELGPEPIRSGDVYVFALLHHQDKNTIDPLDLDQWCFYVVPTKVLNERERSQHSITLPSLEKLAAKVGFDGLRDAVSKAHPMG